jgi:hypothetical protein
MWRSATAAHLPSWWCEFDSRHPLPVRKVSAQDGYPVEGVADPQAWLTPPRQIAAWTALHVDRRIGQISLTRATEEDDAAILWQRATKDEASQLVIPVRLFVDPQHRGRAAGQLLSWPLTTTPRITASLWPST